MAKQIKFTDENIRKIFGSYDGEGENIDRLEEYYLKNDTYDTVLSYLPIRILVGHKGVGKSALFRIAINEEKEELAILIKPDDIAGIGEKHDSLIISIKKWKFGLTEVIAKKVLDKLGLSDEGVSAKIIKVGGKIIPLLTQSIQEQISTDQLSEEQIASINKFIASKKIIVYLDDIDRGWQNRSEGVIMISALINSIRDMSNQNLGLYFKLALRSDVYNAVRTEDESSDKFEESVVWHSYNLPEIFVMLIKRVLTFWGDSFNEELLLKTEQRHIAHHLDTIFEHTFFGNGKWEKQPMYKVILSLIRNRPRDLIKLCTLAAKEAFKENSSLITTAHINSVLPEYSRSIINDTIAEYKSELPHIERLIYGMKPSKAERNTDDWFVYTTSELHKKLWNLSLNGKFNFASGKTADPHDLTSFLFKINFITARKRNDDGTVIRKNYERNSHLASRYQDFGYDWEVHMAYRWAIQPDSLDDALNNRDRII